MTLSVDPDACIFGWGPCPDAYGFSHQCKKRQDHDGLHICEWCGARYRPPAVDEMLTALFGDAMPDGET